MRRFADLVGDCRATVEELWPWDLAEAMDASRPLLLDVREPGEFAALHIEGSLNVPRGVLESACEYGYEETVPELAAARQRDIVVVCRSGNRSLLAARSMQDLGYERVRSLQRGSRAGTTLNSR